MDTGTFPHGFWARFPHLGDGVFGFPAGSFGFSETRGQAGPDRAAPGGAREAPRATEAWGGFGTGSGGLFQMNTVVCPS